MAHAHTSPKASRNLRKDSSKGNIEAKKIVHLHPEKL